MVKIVRLAEAVTEREERMIINIKEYRDKGLKSIRKNEWVAAAWHSTHKELLAIGIPDGKNLVLDKDEEGCFFSLNGEKMRNLNELLNSAPFDTYSFDEKKQLGAKISDVFLYPLGCPECGSYFIQRERQRHYVKSLTKGESGSGIEERYHCPSCEQYFAERKWDADGYATVDTTGIL